MLRVEHYLPGVADALHRIAARSPAEACGYLSRAGEIGEMPNRSGSPADSFDLGTLAGVTALEGEVAAIWHTHPADEPPSRADFDHCRATWLPWIIAGPRRIWAIYPEPLSYLTREFLYGATDCWQLVADWMAQERGRLLPWFRRPPDKWWLTPGASPYLQHAEDYGFVLDPWNPFLLPGLTRGDVLLMRVGGQRTNHAAVYLGGGNILHHLPDHLSRIEQLDARWQRFLTHRARLQ